MGVSPGAAVVLEDSVNGVRAAKAAGMTAIAFANPSAGHQDLTGADLIVDRVDDRIVAFVRSLRAA
jgi:beta-phosphoglucomutase-like phosphatase (HAD superfamily)